MAKYLDYEGLTQFWAKIKTWVYTAVTSNSPSKSKTVTGMSDGKVTYGDIGIDASQVESGTLPITRGGTGSGTAAGARSNLDVYSKAETESLVAGRIVVVTTLPTSGQAGVIYYVGPTGTGDDQYEEYIWDATNAEFIKVGEKSLDLSEYVNTLTTSGSGYLTNLAKDGNELTATFSALPTASASQAGIVQLNNTVTSTSTTQAATANAVKTAYDRAATLIAALDSSATSTDGTNVQVKVTETDGKITGVNITTDNTASASALASEVSRATAAESALDSAKADKVSGATAGNFATLDANGNLTDSGKNESTLSVLSATKLTTARTIDGVSFDGSAKIHHYGECSTAAATAAKVVTLSDSMSFTLEAGASVFVKFTYTNTAASATLNVNGTGAKNIYRYGTTTLGTTATSSWQAGSVVHLVYTGTAWHMASTTYSNAKLGQGYGTCTTAQATAAKVVTLANYENLNGGIVAVKFTYGLVASATMNINSKGARNIFINGAAVTSTTAGQVQAGDIAYFIYDGTQYHLLGTDRAAREPVVSFSDAGTAGTDARLQYTKMDGTTGTVMEAITDAEIAALL